MHVWHHFTATSVETMAATDADATANALGNSAYTFSGNTNVELLWMNNWAPSSEFVSSSIPSWQILTAHAQPFRGARDLAFCLNVPLDSLLVWASSEGSGEPVRRRYVPNSLDAVQLSLVTRKLVFGVCDQVRHKPVYTATEAI